MKRNFSYIPVSHRISSFLFCFVLIDALRPSQQQWSCRDVVSILWDFYPTFGCHDTQNVLYKYNHQTKPIRLTCMDGMTKPLSWESSDMSELFVCIEA